MLVAFAMVPSMAFAADDGNVEWQISKSKTATNLDENFESDVTLSLPAAEEQLVSDVVFVLDKSTSSDLQNEALEMLEALKEQVSKTDAKVKVGVVIFNKVANVTEFKDLETQYDDIKTAITQEIKSGTNTHAGLLAGKEMLDEDTSVDNSRKYLIFVSDGITYYYCKDGDYTKAYTTSALNGGDDGNGNKNCTPNSSLTNWDIKYGASYVPENWSDYFSGIESLMKDPEKVNKYEYEVGSAGIPKSPDDNDDTEKSIPYKDRQNYLINADKSLYGSYQVYKQAAADYNCYVVDDGNPAYAFGTSFMTELGKVEGGSDVTFENIKNDINYLLDAGSYVIDEIGCTDDYNFDFVDKAANLKLTVGNETLDVEKLEDPNGDATSSYGFGKSSDNEYRFVVDYYKDGVVAEGAEKGECFIWDINEAVSYFNPVQLTYSVKLTNPKTEAGSYGKYDADGSKEYEGLYTNNEAILYPKSTNGDKGEAEIFAKPTVSYTVKEQPITPTEPDKPEDSNDNSAKTGDDSNMALWLALMVIAAGGTAVCGRKLFSNKKLKQTDKTDGSAWLRCK